MPQEPIIKKATRIKGKTLVFRNAQTADAEFIFSLRTDSRKATYLSQVAPEMSGQVAWLEDYKKKKTKPISSLKAR